MSDYEMDRESELQGDDEQMLNALLSAPELSTDEWDNLRTRINRACELPLARRLVPRARRTRAVKWLPFALPLAAAATLLLVLRITVRQPPAAVRGMTPDLANTEQLLLQNVSEREFTELVSGAQEAKALLMVAVGEK